MLARTLLTPGHSLASMNNSLAQWRRTIARRVGRSWPTILPSASARSSPRPPTTICSGEPPAAQIQESKDWKELCGSLLPKALSRTESAIGAKPERVEAYFWQLQVISLVYDARGLAPFIAEGLAAKSRRDIEKSSAIDPGYLDYSVLLAQAMYYYNLPPLWGRDLAKALALYREFETHTTWSFEPYRQYIQAATLLIGTKKSENIAHARELLLRSLQDPVPRPYYRELSKKLLAEANALLVGN